MFLLLAQKNKLLVMVALAYGLLYTANPVMARLSAENSLFYLKEMLLVLPVIFLFTVVIEALVPKELILRGFGEGSGLKGNMLALALGSLSAGPIYAAFPVSKTLLNKGATVGNIVIILSAWAVVKVPMLANEVKFLGPQFMAVRWVLTVAAIMIMASVTGMVVKKTELDREPDGTFQPKLTIRREYCIGCGICARLLPQCIRMTEGKAVIHEEADAARDADPIADMVERCPGKAITQKADA
jgi:uncharacterized membrane protein YraQ (UPF0718 family)